ncbi:MAG TPA: hypothetical protein VHK91_04615 [Flavisolibacter sp.]|jgi:hypothetical protein|nr:hypothetical protein [Flavisolibacter sp.]
MKRIILLGCILFLLLGVNVAQMPVVSAKADRSRILIGETVLLELQATQPKSKPIQWFPVDTFAHFEILKTAKADTVITDNAIRITQVLTLTSWDSGRWQIPSFSLGSARTRPLLVDVSYTPMDPNKPYNDIRDIIEVQKPEDSNWWWYVIGVALLLALFALFFPGGKKKAAEVVAVPEDVYQAALARVRKLRPEEEPRILYTELIAAFRYYLEKRKGIQSLSKTTDDLAVQLNQVELPREHYLKLVQVLHLSDLVKFAKFEPLLTDREASLKLIEQTIIELESRK